MPVPSFGQIPTMNVDGASIEQLRAYVKQLQDHLIRQQRDMNYLFQHLDTENIMEVGGWRVTPDQLASKDGDVGMSTEDTGADDIRFWAGGVNKETALYKVRKSGKTTISSSAGYPRIELSADNSLLAAFSNAGNYVTLIPDENGAPALGIFEGGLVKALLKILDGSVTLISVAGQDMDIAAGGNLRLSASGSGRVSIAGGASGSFTTANGKTVTVSNGVVTAIV
jgi:hypothetical protein